MTCESKEERCRLTFEELQIGSCLDSLDGHFTLPHI